MLLFILYVILTSSGLILFKLGSSTNFFHFTLNQLEMHLSLLSLLGIICYGCSFVLWLILVKNESLTYIFPVANGIITLITLAGGIFLLHETLHLPQIIGIMFIIAGILLTNIFK